MAAIDSIKNKLEKLYQPAVSFDSGLSFLRALSDYIDYTKTEPVLIQLIYSIRETVAGESISHIQKSVHDPVYREIRRLEEEVADVLDEPPTGFSLYAYDALEEGYESFSRWKDIKDEKEFSVQRIQVKKKTETGLGEYTNTESGKSLLIHAEYTFPKQLETVHVALLQQLENAKKHGIISKYFRYDAEKGVLYVQGTAVKIRLKKVPTNAHYLLVYLFDQDDPCEEHDYEDMEAENALFGQKSWKSYYDACVDIQKKVKEAIGIDDFLVCISGEAFRVHINPKYSLNHTA